MLHDDTVRQVETSTRSRELHLPEGERRMTTRVARTTGRAVLTALVWTAIAGVATAQGVGAIGGTVLDSSSAVLPGVAVTLSSTQGTVGGVAGGRHG